jgi:hypothetical protein
MILLIIYSLAWLSYAFWGFSSFFKIRKLSRDYSKEEELKTVLKNFKKQLVLIAIFLVFGLTLVTFINFVLTGK